LFPEGHLKMARRFNAGYAAKMEPIP